MINITQEKVVNSLIKKNLDWKYGEITQTGVNTYYFTAEDRLVTYSIAEPAPDFYSREINFINGRLIINQGKRMYDECLTDENAETLYNHVVNKVSKAEDLEEKRFIEWLCV